MYIQNYRKHVYATPLVPRLQYQKKNTFQTERLNRCEYCATARLAAVAYLYSGRTAVGRQTFLRRQLFKVSLSIGLLRAAKV